MLKRIAIGFSALLAICVLLFVLSSSLSFQDCIARQNDAYAQQTKKDLPKFFFALANRAATCVKCTGHLVYEYRDAVTAVATVFIAAFTYTLFAATKGLVEAARIQSADMKRSIAASETSADAAEKTAEAAVTAANANVAALEISRAQIRAYFRCVISAKLDSENKQVVQYTCTNIGQSQARQVMANVLFGFRDFMIGNVVRPQNPMSNFIDDLSFNDSHTGEMTAPVPVPQEFLDPKCLSANILNLLNLL